MKIRIKDNNFITKSLCILMILITGYLFVVSLFSTVYISEIENIYYIKDNTLVNIILLIALVLISCLLREKIGKLISGNERKMVIVNTLVLGVILTYFVLSTRLYPLYDQAKVLNVVKQLCVYDYSGFLPGGYIDRYDVQEGIMLFYYMITRITGVVDITLFQIINVIFVLISNYLIYKITSRLFSCKLGALIHLALCLFVPQWFYVSFVYGTIPSYMFAILSVYLFILIHENQTQANNGGFTGPSTAFMNARVAKNRRIIKSVCLVFLLAVSISISIALKTNSVIILIAIILVSAYYSIKNGHQIYPVMIITALLFYVLSRGAMASSIKDMTYTETQGIPRTGHIAMALMENSDRGPGWYNGYNAEVYEKNNFDTNLANEEAKGEIRNSLNGFKSNPANMISFFSRKIVSQWNEPTFESLFIMYGRDSLIQPPEWVKAISVPTSKLSATLREICNIIQLFVIFGALCYFTLNFKNVTMDKLTLSVIVLGGFFFHILWEAKSQYILVYFILLIPYAVAGLNDLVRMLSKVQRGQAPNGDRPQVGTGTFHRIFTKSSQCPGTIWGKFAGDVFIAMLVVVVITAIVPEMSIPGKILKPSWKTAEYLEVTDETKNNVECVGTIDSDYIESLNMPDYKPLKGRYYLSVAGDENMILSPVSNGDASNESNSRVIEEDLQLRFSEIDEPSFKDSVILFELMPDVYCIRFQKNQKVMDVEMGVLENGSKIGMWEFNGDQGQQFALEDMGDGTSKITCGDFAIKVTEDGSLVLTDMDDKDALKIVLTNAGKYRN